MPIRIKPAKQDRTNSADDSRVLRRKTGRSILGDGTLLVRNFVLLGFTGGFTLLSEFGINV